jgi:hypothetical protein
MMDAQFLKTIVIDKAIPKPHAHLLLTGKIKSYPYETDTDWWTLYLFANNKRN